VIRTLGFAATIFVTSTPLSDVAASFGDLTGQSAVHHPADQWERERCRGGQNAHGIPPVSSFSELSRQPLKATLVHDFHLYLIASCRKATARGWICAAGLLAFAIPAELAATNAAFLGFVTALALGFAGADLFLADVAATLHITLALLARDLAAIDGNSIDADIGTRPGETGRGQKRRGCSPHSTHDAPAVQILRETPAHVLELIGIHSRALLPGLRLSRDVHRHVAPHRRHGSHPPHHLHSHGFEKNQ